MREILFRGKHLDGGNWVYGSLINDRVLGIEIMSQANGFVYHVNPETVGQFIGQRDMHQCPIYEGDILIERNWLNHDIISSIFVIGYDSCGFVYQYIGTYGADNGAISLDDCEDGIAFALDERCEVVTNIHEHPSIKDAYKYVKEKYHA